MEFPRYFLSNYSEILFFEVDFSFRQLIVARLYPAPNNCKKNFTNYFGGAAGMQRDALDEDEEDGDRGDGHDEDVLESAAEAALSQLSSAQPAEDRLDEGHLQEEALDGGESQP